MNILEMEDMVKGLPDQVLTQYAQFPDPQIPQFLALSEMQRRQDMRQRFQAQQQGMEPTVKDQILQGGIASAMPPDGMAPPMDQGMAPPMAPQGPMGPEMGPPPVMAYRGGMMPYSMAGGGMVPGGIVYMQQGRAVPFSYESLTPAQLRKMAEVFGSLGMYPTGGLDRRSFNNLPIERRQQLFAALEREGVSGELDTPRPQTGFFDRVQGTEDINLLVQNLDPQRIRTLFAEALNKGDLSAAERIRSASVGSGKLDPRIADQMFNQITRLRGQEISDAETESFLQERSSQARQDVAQREAARAAEQARLAARADYLTTGATPAPTTSPPATAATTPAATTTVAPDATSTPPAPTDQGIGSLNTMPTMSMDSEVRNMLTQALAPQASPLEAEYEALVRSAMAEGLPPPVDLASYAQAAETRAQTARDEAKRMALAATLGRFGAAIAEGDIAKGIREATTDVQQTLKEGAREARTEEARAEALRLQSAESQRQATIQAQQFKLQSIGSLAQIAREKGASDRQAMLTAANVLADYDSQLKRNLADLQQQNALNSRSFADAMKNAEKSALDYIQTLIRPTEEQTQEVLNQFRRQALATYGYLLSEEELKKVSASLAKKETATEKDNDPLGVR